MVGGGGSGIEILSVSDHKGEGVFCGACTEGDDLGIGAVDDGFAVVCFCNLSLSPVVVTLLGAEGIIIFRGNDDNLIAGSQGRSITYQQGCGAGGHCGRFGGCGLGGFAGDGRLGGRCGLCDFAAYQIDANIFLGVGGIVAGEQAGGGIIAEGVAGVFADGGDGGDSGFGIDGDSPGTVVGQRIGGF